MLSCEIHLCTRRSWFHVKRWLHSIRVEPPSYVGSAPPGTTPRSRSTPRTVRAAHRCKSVTNSRTELTSLTEQSLKRSCLSVFHVKQRQGNESTRLRMKASVAIPPPQGSGQ